MNKAALARAKEAAEAEAGRLRGELADARAATVAAQREAATANARAAAEKAAAEKAAAASLSSANARAAQAEWALAGLRAAVAVAAPHLLVCPALPAEVWAEVLSAVGTRCACSPPSPRRGTRAIPSIGACPCPFSRQPHMV